MITLDDLLLKIPDYHKGFVFIDVIKDDCIEKITLYKDKSNKIRVIRKFHLNKKLYKTNQSIKNHRLVEYLILVLKSKWKITITEQITPTHAGLNPVYINPDKSMKTGNFWTKAFNKLNSLLYK